VLQAITPTLTRSYRWIWRRNWLQLGASVIQFTYVMELEQWLCGDCRLAHTGLENLRQITFAMFDMTLHTIAPKVRVCGAVLTRLER
jgi:Zn-dependent oligopeptidase